MSMDENAYEEQDDPATGTAAGEEATEEQLWIDDDVDDADLLGDIEYDDFEGDSEDEDAPEAQEAQS